MGRQLITAAPFFYMNTKITADSVVDRFFGESFTKHLALLDSILGCATLSQFKDIEQAISAESFTEVFAACASRDDLSAKYNDRECRNAFMRLRAVSVATDFI